MSPGCGLPPAPGDRRFLFTPSGIRPLGAGLARCQDDGLDGRAGCRVQSAVGWVEGESDLAFAQVPDYVAGTGLGPDVETAAGAPPALPGCRLGELQVQGGQV
jgi:hypothetical protein